MPLKTTVALLSGIALLTLSACNSTSPAPTETPAASASAPAASPAPTTATSADTAQTTAQNGGQVVEVGDYHLELLAAPEGDGLHVDFWLQTGSDHASISDAEVTANIQFPDGTSKPVDLTYDAAGEHYKAFVSGFAAGEYRVVVQTDIDGEKVNGRFNFNL
ncbi:hypothetical protein H6F67_25965 [Microcoleus sp. FACHB-1515]|uniref:hypothetical protein n=1 Tax=Cyanophyceae TaxID=3028117 RepID=UPI001681EF49|nr:hypothetical protein [Microcoleus sp. FACHB-1515]MBD2093295.1 hypothetical protein [Microcoleus sp. FACHB-1515]